MDIKKLKKYWNKYNGESSSVMLDFSKKERLVELVNELHTVLDDFVFELNETGLVIEEELGSEEWFKKLEDMKEINEELLKTELQRPFAEKISNYLLNEEKNAKLFEEYMNEHEEEKKAGYFVENWEKRLAELKDGKEKGGDLLPDDLNFDALLTNEEIQNKLNKLEAGVKFICEAIKAEGEFNQKVIDLLKTLEKVRKGADEGVRMLLDSGAITGYGEFMKIMEKSNKENLGEEVKKLVAQAKIFYTKLFKDRRGKLTDGDINNLLDEGDLDLERKYGGATNWEECIEKGRVYDDEQWEELYGLVTWAEEMVERITKASKIETELEGDFLNLKIKEIPFPDPEVEGGILGAWKDDKGEPEWNSKNHLNKGEKKAVIDYIKKKRKKSRQ